MRGWEANQPRVQWQAGPCSDGGPQKVSASPNPLQAGNVPVFGKRVFKDP